MGKVKDLTGQVFGRLTVIEHDVSHVRANGKRVSKWKCICSCGEQKTVRSGDLISGDTKSCGCYGREIMSKNGKIVGKLGRKENQPLLRLFKDYKRNAQTRNLEFNIDLEIFRTLMTANCSLCKAEPKENFAYYNAMKAQCLKLGRYFDEEYFSSQKIKVNGIDRMNPEIGYTKSNCITACTVCNTGKMGLERGNNNQRAESHLLYIQHCLAVVKNNYIIVNNELILKETK